MRVGSLFSGIGGLELGLERAGMKTVWQVECDEYARRVLRKHWPDVWRPYDVRQVHASTKCKTEAWPCSLGCVGPVDIICGGFPRQDISLAGKGAGLAGERSGLWSEFRRLIGELRPRFVLVENVAALLVRGLGDVLGDLASLGYDAEWSCIPAAAVGAPHRRDRLFIVAYAQREFLREQSEPIARCGRPDESRVNGAQGLVANTKSNGWGQGWPGRLAGDGSDGQGQSSEKLANADGGGCKGRGQSEPGRLAGPCGRVFDGRGALRQLQDAQDWGRKHWAIEPDVGRVANGVPSRVDRLRCLGNAVVPQVAEFIGRRIMEAA